MFLHTVKYADKEYQRAAFGLSSRFLSPDALKFPDRGPRIRLPVDRPNDAEVPGAAAQHLREVPAVDPPDGNCRHRGRSDDRRHPFEAEDRVGDRLGRRGEHRTDPDVIR